MKEVTATVINEKGLHTRPSTVLVKTAMTFQSDIEVRFNGVKADGKSVMGLLALGAKKGSELKLWISGSDEEEAATTLRELIDGGISEEVKVEPH
jgi:phosphocarrier protein HPr